MFDIYTHHNIPKCKTQLYKNVFLAIKDKSVHKQMTTVAEHLLIQGSIEIMHNILSLLNMYTSFV